MYPSIKLQQHDLDHYILYQSCEPKAIDMRFSYNVSNHTGHLKTTAAQRIFVIDKEGMRHNKLVIKNEHGYIIGRLVPYTGEGWNGLIEIEGRQYGYILAKNGFEIEIYDSENHELLLNCLLPISDHNQQFQPEDTAGISLGLCWYSYLQHRQD